jgi:hypothetical protein
MGGKNVQLKGVKVALTSEQSAHLDAIKDRFIAEVDAKYRKGVQEHGGNLWLKSALLDEALDEVVDLYVYLITLKSQIAKLH